MSWGSGRAEFLLHITSTGNGANNTVLSDDMVPSIQRSIDESGTSMQQTYVLCSNYELGQTVTTVEYNRMALRISKLGILYPSTNAKKTRGVQKGM